MARLVAWLRGNPDGFLPGSFTDRDVAIPGLLELVRSAERITVAGLPR